MSNVIRSLIVKVGADTTDFSNKMNYMSKDLKGISKSLNSTGRDLSRAGATLTKSVTLPIVGIGVASGKAAIDFESAFAGVKKTVDASVEDLAKLETGIRDMAKEIPASAVEIAGVAEAAGQLGIEVPNIMDFTRVMIDLGNATNLSADEAATSLARFANITGMSQSEFDKLGSTIVDLGNNLATTESEIVAMGMRLAGAGKQIGLSEAEIMSFAGSLSSVGIEAEAGGSAFSKLMVNMQLASETGITANDVIKTTGMSLRDLQMLADADGKSFKALAQSLGLTSTELKGYMSTAVDLNAFAKVTGKTAEEFAKAFSEDATGAIIDFIGGLATAEERGMSAIAVLDEMGITEIRLRDALLRASGASDVFTESLEIGTTAWNENNALTKEAEQRYGTTASQIEIAKNKMKDAGITIGEVLAPHLVTLIDKVTEVVEWFGNLNPETQESIIKMAALAATIGPVISVAGSLTSGLGGLFGTVSKVTKGVGAFSTAIQGGSSVIGALGTAIGPGGAVMLGMAAFAAAAVLIYQNWDKITAAVKNAINWVKEFLGINEQAERDYDIHDYRGGGWNTKPTSTVIDSSITAGTRWNADGAIFTRPTVLPTIAGWQGFGEAGPEAVIPLDKLNMSPNVYVNVPVNLDGRVITAATAKKQYSRNVTYSRSLGVTV